jgi:hypothetical protein
MALQENFSLFVPEQSDDQVDDVCVYQAPALSRTAKSRTENIVGGI